MNSEHDSQIETSCLDLVNTEGKKRESIGLYKHLGTVSFATFIYLGKEQGELCWIEKVAIILMGTSTLFSILAIIFLVANYSGKNIYRDERNCLKKLTYGTIITFILGLVFLFITIIFFK